MKAPARIGLIIIVLVCVMANPVNVYSCGPFFSETLFVNQWAPDFGLQKYAAGELGIVQQEYSGLHLFLAYRWLSGRPLSAAQQQMLLRGENQPATWWMPSSGYNEWLAARRKVPGCDSGMQVPLEAEVPSDQGHSYQFYLNVTDDALHTAAQTLEQRIAQFGAGSEAVREWLRAQDEVFLSEQTGRAPGPADAGLPALIRADRAYQIAAAHFYMRRFVAAESLFTSISRDAASPWSTLSRYLVARTLIRRATLTNGNGDSLLWSAQVRLREIIGDERIAELHEAARRLLSFARFRTEPEKLFADLDRSINAPTSAERFYADWSDYVRLLGRIRDTAVVRAFDFPDWLECFRGHGPAHLPAHAIERWEQTKSPAWLIASLAHAAEAPDRLPELLDAADAIQPGSPAYATVLYMKARLSVSKGDNGEARRLIGRLLDAVRPLGSVSNTNLALAERARVVDAFEDFLRYCFQRPSSTGWAPGDAGVAPDNVMLFTGDASVLNRYVPLRLLDSACTSPLLPENLRAALVRATWVRAFLLDNTDVAVRLSSDAGGSSPELRPLLDEYRISGAEDARRFAGAFLLLRNPGLQPSVREGQTRSTPLDAVDDFRDNWWYSGEMALGGSAREVFMGGSRIEGFWKEAPGPPPRFLSQPDQIAAGQETEALRSLPCAPNYLAAIVNEWANGHRDDPRVPEALHLTVRAARVGCRDSLTTAFARESFRILHTRYPKSPWAEKTKYYY